MYLLWTITENAWWTNNDLNVPLAIAFLRSKMVLFWNRAVSFITTRKFASAKPELLWNRTNLTPMKNDVFRNTWNNSRSTMRLLSSKRLDIKSASSLVKLMFLSVNLTWKHIMNDMNKDDQRKLAIRKLIFLRIPPLRSTFGSLNDKWGKLCHRFKSFSE